jgi:anthranilate synthase component 1
VRRGPSYAVERETPRPTAAARCDRAKEYIAAGDCMQVVIGQRLRKRYTESPLSLYRALRSLNPSPYMYYYDMGDFQIVGASPRSWCARSATPEAGEGDDPPAGRHAPARRHARGRRALEAELRADPKERAEHLMLIDLARNDIGRIAKPAASRSPRPSRSSATRT